MLHLHSTRRERFDAKWMPEPNTGCHLWLGGVNEHGYGVFWNGERLEKAHRWAFCAAGGVLASTDDLCHRCDTPACVNPLHCFAGRAIDNTNDMWRKHRAVVLRRFGTAQTQAKLDDVKVLEIRLIYLSENITQRELASIYGVSQRAIWRVVNYKGWKRASGVLVEKGRGKC